MAINSAEENIVIAGAGIAGMMTALALAAHNIPSVLYEKSAVLQEVGAGIQLASNAARLLRRLGLLERIAPYTAEPDFINLSSAATGKNLLHLPIKTIAGQRWHAPYFTIHRADLQKVLKEQIDANPLITYFGGCNISFIQGNAETGFEADITAKSALQKDMTRPAHENTVQTLSARHIICCDGVWSPLRAACGEKAQFSGFIAWRATLEQQDLPESFNSSGALNSISAYMSKDSHFIIYPLRKGAIYNFIITTKGKNIGDSWSQPGDKKALLRLFGRQAPFLRDLIEKIPSWTYWPLFQMPFPRFLGANGAIFLGDAAHAVPPFAAQGAAQAIEDACALAETMAAGLAEKDSGISLAAGLRRFSAIRTQRLKAVAGRGDFNQFVYHLSGPMACARNLVMRLRPQKCFLTDLDGLYGYDALAPFAGLPNRINRQI